MNRGGMLLGEKLDEEGEDEECDDNGEECVEWEEVGDVDE